MIEKLVFKTEEFSKTEQDIITEVFDNPTVKKYLRIMGQNDVTELAELSISGMSDNEVSKKHCLIQGKLSVISTLLSITKPKGATS